VFIEQPTLWTIPNTNLETLMTDLCSSIASRLSFQSAPYGDLRTAFEVIASYLVQAKNQQAADGAAHRLAQTFGETLQALRG
jgi:hypothetical protein